MEADLHVHTTASDGVLNPDEVVRLATSNNVHIISITDHDTVSGIEEGLRSAKDYNLELIPGVELSTAYLDQEIHILGYYIDYKSEWLNNYLSSIREGRVVRTKRIIEKLQKIGVNIALEDVFKDNSENKYKTEGSMGRPHIARVLIEKGYAKDMTEAFNNYLVKGTPAFVEREKISTFEAIESITKAGGVPVLAHPGLLSGINLGNLIERLKGKGLKGIEVYHPSHDINVTRNVYKLALKHRLLLTGGSDYHGEIGTENGLKSTKVRTELGSVGVTKETVELLKREKYGSID